MFWTNSRSTSKHKVSESLSSKLKRHWAPASFVSQDFTSHIRHTTCLIYLKNSSRVLKLTHIFFWINKYSSSYTLNSMISRLIKHINKNTYDNKHNYVWSNSYMDGKHRSVQSASTRILYKDFHVKTLSCRAEDHG